MKGKLPRRQEKAERKLKKVTGPAPEPAVSTEPYHSMAPSCNVLFQYRSIGLHISTFEPTGPIRMFKDGLSEKEGNTRRTRQLERCGRVNLNGGHDRGHKLQEHDEVEVDLHPHIILALRHRRLLGRR